MKGWGAKKCGMSFETQGSHTFWLDIPGLPDKFEKEMVCVQVSSPKNSNINMHRSAASFYDPLVKVTFLVALGGSIRAHIVAKTAVPTTMGAQRASVMGIGNSETGRIRFRSVRLQTPNSVSFF